MTRFLQTIIHWAPYVRTTVLINVTVELGVVMLIFFFHFSFNKQKTDSFCPSFISTSEGVPTCVCFVVRDGEDPTVDSADEASFTGAVVSKRCQTGSLQTRNADCKKTLVLLNRLFGEERNNRKMVSLLLTHAVFCCVGTELICWSLASTCAVKLKNHF